MASIGLAHRTAPTPMTPELAAYVAAGGLLGDICGAEQGKDAPALADCEACRLTDNILASGGKHIVSAENPQMLAFAFVAKRIAARNDLDPARLTRAPPRA